MHVRLSALALAAAALVLPAAAGAYGGGQFELGVGRGQIQALASLFHADAPNDIAPGVYNLPDPPAELPRSPLEPRLVDPGFGWQL